MIFLNIILMHKLLLCIILAKMIIVDMPWIMNGENEHALSNWYTQTFTQSVSDILSINMSLFQLRGRLWSRGWVLRPSASSSLQPNLRSRRSSASSTCHLTWVERYVVMSFCIWTQSYKCAKTFCNLCKVTASEVFLAR